MCARGPCSTFLFLFNSHLCLAALCCKDTTYLEKTALKVTQTEGKTHCADSQPIPIPKNNEYTLALEGEKKKMIKSWL